MGIFALFPICSVKCRLRALAEMRLVAVPCVSNVHATLRSLCRDGKGLYPLGEKNHFLLAGKNVS